MDKINKIFWSVLALFVLLSFPVSFYFLGKAFLTYLSYVDKTVAASIIAASGTIFAAVLTVVTSQYISKKREIEEAHRERKTDLYSKYIDFTIDWVQSSDQKRTPKEEIKRTKEIEKFLINFSKEYYFGLLQV